MIPRVDPRASCCSAFVQSHLYTAPQYVEPWHTVSEASGAVLAALGERSMQDPATELRRIPLLRRWVNKGK